MGQQQLLLVILVTIIVGIATVVAINIFGQSANNANVDAARQDVLTLAAMSQGWYIKPTMLGGGGGTFANIDVDDLGFGYDKDATNAGPQSFENSNASFTLTPSGETSLQIVATCKQADKTVTVTVYPSDIDDPVVADV
ncbi:hypothetical protein [Fodinibius sediminis]|uniref:MSHA pilin protein MshD n=1 Tax=Fodinibius sediminis TaxID=1214077 RepID=A0A521EMX5_9BACT|nr:hypothetical protein [Fodinibius sediminis]SMO85267.1 hypothetical protein SAMN06265218_11770 [Fodinibius sediminis]